MVVISAGETPIGDKIRKKLGSPSLYGTRGYGAHEYGAGADYFGIYQIRSEGGKQVIVKLPLYVPTNPQTEIQQANRQKITNGVIAWQSLTDEQKEVYNEKAKYKRYSGYNLYLREYLLSN